MAPWGDASAGYNAPSLQEPTSHSLSVHRCLSLHSRTSGTVLSASLAASNKGNSFPTWWASQALAAERQMDLGHEMPNLPQNSHPKENLPSFWTSFSLFFSVPLHVFPFYFTQVSSNVWPILISIIWQSYFQWSIMAVLCRNSSSCSSSRMVPGRSLPGRRRMCPNGPTLDTSARKRGTKGKLPRSGKASPQHPRPQQSCPSRAWKVTDPLGFEWSF